jgi:hypothetical protein
LRAVADTLLRTALAVAEQTAAGTLLGAAAATEVERLVVAPTPEGQVELQRLDAFLPPAHTVAATFLHDEAVSVAHRPACASTGVSAEVLLGAAVASYFWQGCVRPAGTRASETEVSLRRPLWDMRPQPPSV